MFGRKSVLFYVLPLLNMHIYLSSNMYPIQRKQNIYDIGTIPYKWGGNLSLSLLINTYIAILATNKKSLKHCLHFKLEKTEREYKI